MTTARVSVEEDRHRRMRNYLLAMGFRIVGFPVSVWLLLHGYVILGVALAVFATVVPSIAVVIANAVDRRGTSSQDATPVSPVQALGPVASPVDDRTPEGPAPARAEEIHGTVVSSRETPYPNGGPEETRRPGARRDDHGGREAS